MDSEGWIPSVSPSAGSAAVPETVSVSSRITGPSRTVTLSPTFLCSAASVAGPSTMSPGPLSPLPDRICGPTAGRAGDRIAGTVCPSICTVRKYTPVLVAISLSRSRIGVTRAAGNGPHPSVEYSA